MYKQLDLKSFLKKSFLIGLIGFPVGLIWCNSCLESLEWTLKAGLFSSVIWIFMWQGNGLLSDYLCYRMPWMENPVKRLIWGIIGILVYTPLAMLFINLFFSAIWNVSTGMTDSFEGFLGSAGIAIGITVVISLVINARSFFLSWRQSAINAEKLKRESLKSQFEALKAQINPHFLFNSLNALSSLVYKDADLSAKFIKQLSLVYRYLLENQSKEVVTLEEEINFVNSYIFLQKIRYGENLKVNFEFENAEEYLIPPLSIQVLIENAIKHNELSSDNPLEIFVTVDNDFIEVRNNLQIKNRPVEDSPRIGLSNLKERFLLLSGKEIKIDQDNYHFRVSLPLLKKTYESSHT